MATAKQQGRNRGTSKRPAKAAKAAKKAISPARRKSVPPAAKAAGTKARVFVERRLPETLRVRAISPGLTVADLGKSIAFYTGALGFIADERWESAGKLTFIMLKAGLCELGLGQDDWAKGRERKKGEGFRIWCETTQDIDALAARARAFGARITEEPADKPWGVRAFSLDDPDGFHLTFARPLAK